MKLLLTYTASIVIVGKLEPRQRARNHAAELVNLNKIWSCYLGRYKAHTNNRYIDNSYYKKALEKYEQRQQDKEKDKTSSKSSARDNTQQPSEKDVQDAIKGI